MADRTCSVGDCGEMLVQAQEGLAASARHKLANEYRFFMEWLDGREPSALNAAAYIATSELAAGSVRVRRWALESIFRYNDAPCSCARCTWNDAVALSVLVGTPGQATRRLVDDDVRSMLHAIDVTRRESTPKDVQGARDACLITLVRGTGMRRSEVVALNRQDVGGIFEHTLIVRLSDSVKLTRNTMVPTLDPVKRLQEWMRYVPATSGGPLFVSVDRHGNMGNERLSARVVTLAVKRWAEVIGMDPSTISAESLRSA